MATGLSAIDSTRFKNPSRGTISYSDDRYWTARYGEKPADPKQADTSFAPFEWYLRYEQLKEVLQPILAEATPPALRPPSAVEGQEAAEGEAEAQPPPPKPRILVLGCGTSALSEELYNGGYTSITNVDRCAPLIEHLATKHEAKEGLCYKACELKDMPQDWNSQFDVVIDKACLDTIACGSAAREEIPAALSAVNRVLKPLTGVYVSVSHAAPEIRQPMLSGTNDMKVVVSKKNRWRVSSQPLPRLLMAPPDAPAGAKGGAAPKGGGVELKASAAFRADDHVYNMYMCRRPPALADDAGGWFDFWASPDTVLTRDTLARSLIKSLYVTEAERAPLRTEVATMWTECCNGAEGIDRDKLVSMASMLCEKFVPTPQAS